MRTLPYEGLETRRIILMRMLIERHPEVLLGSEGTHCSLPQVQIVRGQRVAEHLTAAFKVTCGMDAVSVSSIETHPAESHSEQIIYEIMEPHKPWEDAPRDKHWLAVDSLDESGFHDRNDFHAVGKAVAQFILSSEDAFRRTFARLGWFCELEQWVQEEIRPHGLRLSGRFRQLNAYPTFSLIRFETDGLAVWFKAVGAPNEHEYPLTLDLANSFSRFLPRVVATQPECNGWLAVESEGPILRHCNGPAAWETAARAFARLQIHSLKRCEHLLDLGARDLRTSALADRVKPFFKAMGEIMERQPKMSPAPLSRERLGMLSAQVQAALSLFEATGFPQTLGHTDLNPGNIICSPEGPVFLDWAEAFVGHPLITFGYLLEHFRRAFGLGTLYETQLVASYILPWSDLVSESDVHDALEVMPLIAVFACAAGNDRWTNPNRLEEPRTAGYLRSLTRRMDVEARRLAERSIHAQVD